MEISFAFILSQVLLGVGLAMDAFSVSLANGLNEPLMKTKKITLIAGVFGIFQAIMPLAGWVIIHTLVEVFSGLIKFIPWISLILLGYIGGKMLYDGLKNNDSEEKVGVTFIALIVQGIATSIDALSVGLTIAEYKFLTALLSATIIAVITFIICFIGVLIGKKFGTKLSNKAQILGGCILIFIGLEIFIKSFI